VDARLKLTDAERAALELVERATGIADVIVQQPAGDYQPGQFGS
jgi:hypothetical protein